MDLFEKFTVVFMEPESYFDKNVVVCYYVLKVALSVYASIFKSVKFTLRVILLLNKTCYYKISKDSNNTVYSLHPDFYITETDSAPRDGLKGNKISRSRTVIDLSTR
jgi:hypothetical protein